ncbi:transglycosylase [Dolosicoccus paucivorans]|uniref:Transglycosylase n=1 Tax=Dolosicoccus paucivorans TaxID=84521 RepID=A0A2N6SNJ3_9LACT|nr:transglycosylase domain-containing protein [Dolosicoccus paucivorans]PMB84038.1 transglycosylase [Dolosicoccus paucivorans]PMC58622.1 transglycosylase [Dolosicoccus paucivorans]
MSKENSHSTNDHLNNSESVQKKERMNSSESSFALNHEYENLYDISDYSSKEKIVFGLNVFFKVFKRLLIILFLILGVGGFLATGTATGYFASLVANTPPPTKEEMSQQIHRLEELSTLYYANREPIANVQADVVRQVVSLEEINPFITDGLIATEDEYFYHHQGVMPKAILRAGLQEIFSPGSGTGGSTLTQQLVKQQMLTNDVTFFRKANEILLALRVENYFDKEEILTAYLNVSPFGRNNRGENIAGIAKASEGIFGKKTNEVTLPQAAFLVGLPQDPYTYTPYNQYGQIKEDTSEGVERMKEVLFRMLREEKISQQEYDEAIQYDITQDFLPTDQKSEERQSYLYQAVLFEATSLIMEKNLAEDNLSWEQLAKDDELYQTYFDQAEEEIKTGGYHVVSTVDKEIYDQLQQSAAQYSDELGMPYEGIYVNEETGYEHYYVETVQSGIVVMENDTGRVLGFVSGTDFEDNQIDHAFRVHRSPGSTIKPIAVYAPALQENVIAPSTIVADTAYIKEFEDGSVWTPTNYGETMSNEFMTARKALYRSDNLPTIRIYEELLNRQIPIIDYLDKMGFNIHTSYTKEDTENLAFSIGGVPVGPTVFEQTRAFTTFANNGQYIKGHLIERIEASDGTVVFQEDTPPVEVFAEDANYLIVDMLKDTMSEGTGRIARGYMEMGGEWIAKSGISENSKDVWFIAATPSITVGSWIGYDSKYDDYTININDGYGIESERSQLYWSRIVNDLYRIRPEIFGVERSFNRPSSVMETEVLEQTGTLPGEITLNGQRYSITGPLVKEIFRMSNPPPSLRYDFMFNRNEEEIQQFWGNLLAQLEKARQQEIEERNRQRQENRRRSSQERENSSREESSNNASPEETPNETNTNEQNNNNDD